MRRTNDQREQDRAFVANLMSLHPEWTAKEIRKKLCANRVYDLSVSTIENDIKSLREDWKRSSLVDFDLMRTQELREINTIQAFCYEVFFGSATEEKAKFLGRTIPKKQRRSITTVFSYILDSQTDEVVPAPTGQTTQLEFLQGDAEWLKQCLMDCSGARRKLMGLDAPIRNEITGSGGGAIEIDSNLQSLIDKAYGDGNNK